MLPASGLANCQLLSALFSKIFRQFASAGRFFLGFAWLNGQQLFNQKAYCTARTGNGTGNKNDFFWLFCFLDLRLFAG
jgi:hypothetical protein